MCRSKKVLAALIGLCLMASSALAQSDSLISDEMIKTETVKQMRQNVGGNAAAVVFDGEDRHLAFCFHLNLYMG